MAHRSLGRCISIIKSLRKSYWPQSLIDVSYYLLKIKPRKKISFTYKYSFTKTLYELVRSNSNHVWESNVNHHSNDGSSSLSKQLNLTLRNNKKPSSKETRLIYKTQFPKKIKFNFKI